MKRHLLHAPILKLSVQITLQNFFLQTFFHHLPPIFPYTRANSFRPRATRLPTFVSFTDRVSAISRYESPWCLNSRQLRIGSFNLSSARRVCSISTLRL